MSRTLLVLVMLGCLVAVSARAAEVKDVRLWRAPDHTRVVFDLSAPAEHKLIVLEKPARIVVDITNINAKVDLSALTLDNTPITQVRTGIRNGRDLRVVFDMSAVVDPRSFTLKANAQAGDRLVLDLYDRDADKSSAKTAPTEPAVKKSVDSAGKRNIVIAIDAGHGGEDPGALGPNRLREKDVVLAIARELNSLFKKDRGFKPILVRSGDYYVSLTGRPAIARKQQADIFVSIHADAFSQPQANGASVYALSTRGATSTAASYLAQKENASDLVGGVSLSDKDDVLAGVLADLSMTSTLDTSLNVGAQVLKRMGNVVRLHKRKVEQAGFVVLKSPDMPSILVETGFISNPTEARRLRTRSYQRKMAEAIHAGIRDWFNAHPPAGTLLAWQRQQGNQQYVIARGDTLSEIAERFNVPLSDLKTVNGLSGSRIRVGQTITIPAT